MKKIATTWEEHFTNRRNDVPKDKFSLDCGYYNKEFDSLQKLLDDVMISGMDPNYRIIINGKPTAETAWDLIGPVA
jgi:hypothetical protein